MDFGLYRFSIHIEPTFALAVLPILWLAAKLSGQALRNLFVKRFHAAFPCKDLYVLCSSSLNKIIFFSGRFVNDNVVFCFCTDGSPDADILG